MARAGPDRARVFQSSSNRPVYAYYVQAGDPTRMIREDAAGRKTVGRFVSGRFRPLRSANSA